jgi:pantothenate synthetase
MLLRTALRTSAKIVVPVRTMAALHAGHRWSQYVGITVASFDLELSVVCGFQKRSDSLR